MFALRVAFDDLDRAENQIAPDLDVAQLILSRCERLIEKCGESVSSGVLHPVAAFYCFHGFLRCAKLRFVLIVI